MTESNAKFSAVDFNGIKTRQQLREVAEARGVDAGKHMRRAAYEQELLQVQAELVDLQQWVSKTQKRVAVIFEGRDASGKGGTIRRFIEHLNPRSARIVALTKPTDVERGQWYFQRYIKELPNPGEMVFFDRSWYNRAVVEPVMGFCSDQQYDEFMVQVPEFEHMLYEDGVHMVKFWFSISRETQKARFEARLATPLKRWKYSPVDEKGQELWERYTHYKERMFAQTHTSFSPWVIVKANSKKKARVESMRYVLSRFEYEGRGDNATTVLPDPNVVRRYHRLVKQIDV